MVGTAVARVGVEARRGLASADVGVVDGCAGGLGRGSGAADVVARVGVEAVRGLG